MKNIYITRSAYMSNKSRVLVADDEDRIRRLIRMYLEKEDFTIEEAGDGQEALDLALKNDYDLILLDIMMPEMDGIEVCQEIRLEKTTPIIMLTAKGEESNRIQGFEAGADDYIVKPFSPREVILRAKAVLRRVTDLKHQEAITSSKNLIVFPHLTIDLDAYKVTTAGKDVSLTPKEYELLCFLARSPDKVFNREDLLKEVWQYEFFGDLRTVDTHIKRLREKLTGASKEAANMITTVWGVGYKLEVDDT